MKLWLESVDYKNIANRLHTTITFAKVKLIKASGIYREMYDEDACTEDAKIVIISAKRQSSHI